jgi:hypothetical protein
MPLSQLEHLKPDNLKLASPPPLTRHPAAVYISGLGVGSQRTIRYSLSAIAALLTQGECDAYTIDWSKLRYHHTAAVRVALIQSFAPVTANKMLSALRRVLLEAYRLNLMAAEDYNKAVDFPNIQLTQNQGGVLLPLQKLWRCWRRAVTQVQLMLEMQRLSSFY